MTTPAAAPVSISLPKVADVLTPTQWAVFMSLMDAVVPEIRKEVDNAQAQDASVIHIPSADYSDTTVRLRNAVSPANPSSDDLETYLAERPSSNPAFAELLRVILSNLPPDKQRALRILLFLLK
jgi:hypothetical protein